MSVAKTHRRFQKGIWIREDSGGNILSIAVGLAKEPGTQLQGEHCEYFCTGYAICQKIGG